MDEASVLQAAGFSPEEAQPSPSVRPPSASPEEIQTLKSAGFSDTDFGVQPEPDMSAMKAHVVQGISSMGPPSPEKVDGPVNGLPGPVPQSAASAYSPDDSVVKNTLHAVEAGLQISVPGLIARGQKPGMLLPEDAPAFYRIASQMSTMAGDFPAMVAGSFAGGLELGALGLAAGAAGGPALSGTLGAAGVTVGMGAGAFALPAGMRRILMDHYEKGDIKDFQDFWERTSAVFLDSLKQGVVGGVTAGVGMGAKAVAPAAPALVKTVGVAATEIATMVTLGKAMDGQVPHWKDFLDAGAAVLFMHGAMKAPELLSNVPKVSEMAVGKLREIYAQTGVKPDQVVEMAAQDPLVRQEVLADGNQLPKALEPFKEPPPEAPPKPEYKGTGDVKEMDGIASQLAQAVRDGHMSEEEAISEVMPTEFNLDKADKDYVEQVVRGELAKPEEPETHEMPEDGQNKALLPSSEPEELVVEPPKKPLLDSERGAIGAPAQTPEPTTPLGKARKAILDRVESRPENEGEKFTWDKFYENMIDKFDPFRRLVKDITQGADLPASEDPYKLIRLSRDYIGKAVHFLRYGTLKFDTLNNLGKGLSDILAPFSSALERQNLSAYLVSKRALELEGRGIESGMDVDAAKLIVEQGKAKYDAAAQQLVHFQNDALEYLRDSGRISDEQLRAIKQANQHYVPFHRITEEGDAVGGGKRGANPIKKIKGSENKIVDPIESIVRNTFEYIRLAENNRGLVKLLELVENTPGAEKLVQKAKTPLKPIEVDPQEQAKSLRDMGFDDATPGALEGFTIFRKNNLPLADNQIVVYREGKGEVYEVAPDVARAYRALEGNKPAMSMAFRIAAAPARALRASLSLTPDFILRNFIRDQMTAGAFAKYRALPVFDSLVALGDQLKESESYRDWLKSGGTSAAFVSIDRDYVEENVWALSKKTGLLDSAMNVVRHPLEMMRVGSELIENSTRLAEFKRVVGQGDNIFEGGFASREVTVDFQRMGAATQGWNAITAFWNAQLQGLDRAGRAFAEAPAETSLRVAAGITLPSVLLWYHNQAPGYKERYDELPRWQKDLFWIIQTPDHIWRIPKPFEVGVLFGSLAERALEGYFNKNPKAYKDFADTLQQGASPGLLPTAITPFIEHFANKSTFTGHQIIPAPLEKLLPQDQAMPYTSETAKILGRAMQSVPVLGPLLDDMGPTHNKLTSPMILENYIRSWSGNFGIYMLKLADKALIDTHVIPDPVKPADHLEDLPFIKAFLIRYPSSSAQSIQDFYENFTKHKEMQDHRDYLIKTGNVQQLQKDFAPEELGNIEKLTSLNAFREAMSNQNAAIQKINQDKSMSPNDKRQLIDKIYSGMIETAKQGNQLVQTMHEKLTGGKK